jgi:hypothetical protein
MAARSGLSAGRKPPVGGVPRGNESVRGSGPSVGSGDETELGSAPPDDGDLETLAPSAPPVAAPSTPRPVASPSRPRVPPSGINPVLTTSDPIGGGRFAPGVIVAERYRIVALLGRGGMGEVYRAEDLRLSQLVAIKFLPEALSRDAAVLARFHAEVRIARQVSHPNVCRVFDIGDEKGIPFLTMEFVDGEDLSSLVRRIGRLPQDKATEVSRQICAGLAAAHERGVIHRDLKPSNVMLDGAGKARITDFGLASIAANIQGAEARAGTPAYMAPEQLAGREVTFKSDIYALGLVMYEVLTGRRAYSANTLAELIKAREEGTVTNPSTLVKDLDPLIERVILRCLEKDPAKRPSSALQVAAALPGGDPLAAALAAGETPSPEMVAASGETEGTHPMVAFGCLLAALVVMGICVYVAIRESGLERMKLAYSAEVLTHKARETIASLGYADEPKDTASGFSYDDDFLDYLDKKDKPGMEWNRVLTERPPILRFWYRQSPEDMVATDTQGISMTPGVVRFADPQQTFSGMVNVRMDAMGRLLYFQAIPAEREEHPSAATEAPNWQPLFAAAGLEMTDFHSSPSSWNSLASSDARTAWDGVWPGTSRPLHVEAAAWHGKPVFFLLASAWTNPSRMPPPTETKEDRIAHVFRVVLFTSLEALGIWLAYRNYKRGKGDVRGAWRVAKVIFALEMVLFLLFAHLSAGLGFISLLLMAAGTGLLLSAIFWTFYLALEPYVRAKWPQTIVSWTRLLSGKWRDPLVGRDVLYGVVLGLTWVLVYVFGYFFDLRVGEQPLFGRTELMEGVRATIGLWASDVLNAVLGAIEFFFLLVLLRVLVRNRWLAAVLFVALFAFPQILGSSHKLINTPVWIVIYGIAAFAVVRFGLVVLAAAVFTANLMLNLPYTLNWGRWYAGTSGSVLVSLVVVAVWGCFTSLAGRKLLKEDFFD